VSDLPGYLVYRGLSGVFGLFPEPLVRGAGRGLGKGLSHVAGERFALGKRHMRRALGPDAPDAEVEAATREMFASYGRYWAEVFWFRVRRKEEVVDRARVTGLEHLDDAREQGRGIILALPHIGNWDVAGAVAEALEMPVMAVVEDLPNRRIQEWFYDTRKAFGIDPVVAGEPETVRKLLRCLKDGGVVALVSDRDVTGSGVDVEFFGEKTTMPGGPAAMADRTGAAMVPVAPFFAEGAGYDMIIYPELELPSDGSRADRVRAGTQAYADALEEIIRDRPTQWHIMVPNWPSDVP